MRSSRQKLKLLRSLGSCPNSACSPTVRNNHHHNQQYPHSPIRNNARPGSPPSRTPRNNRHRMTQSSQAPPPFLTQGYRDNSTSATSAGHGIRTGSRESLDENVLAGSPDIMVDNNGPTGEIRAKAFNICQDYLHGTWKQIDLQDLVMKRVTGGLSNYLYHCSIPVTRSPIGNEPSEVLLRFYGQVHGEDALESLITESVIFALLSERKLGPKLYGVFPGGRIEQFLPSRPLQTHELRDPGLSPLIAQKMAQIHALNIPISKEASWLWGTMDRWMTSIRGHLINAAPLHPKHEDIILKLSQYNLDEELNWLRKFLTQVESPVLFSHNDMQEGNILIRPNYETLDEKLVLIDFEYCSYNYRGFDLANHFCEWTFNYNVETHPNFIYTESDYPSHEEKLRFIRDYITILRTEYERNFPDRDKDTSDNSPLFIEEHISKEVEAFTLASHFFWTLWAIVNAQVSKIPFGYWEYGLSRLETYYRLKKKFV